jgi:hypothetical protein
MVGQKIFVPVSTYHTLPKVGKKRPLNQAKEAKDRKQKVYAKLILLTSESIKRSKRWKTEGLRKTTSIEELSFATSMSLRRSGNTSAAKLIHEAVATTPTRA